MTAEINLSLHPAQVEVVEQRKQFNVLCCGRRWGKTTLTDYFGLETISTGAPLAYFCPTYKMLTPVFKHWKAQYYPIIKDLNVQERYIEFKTGSIMDFWSFESYDSVRGRKYKRVMLDEVAMFKDLESAWLEAVLPTLTDYDGDAFFLSTPKGMNYYHSLSLNEQKGSQGWRTFKYPTRSNPFIKNAVIERFRANMTHIAFLQEFEAEFVQASGTLVKRENLHYAEYIPEGMTICMGVDLAIGTKDTNDYTAVAVVGRDGEGNVYILDIERIRVGFHEVVNFIKAKIRQWQPESVAVEAVQFQAAVVEELMRSTIDNIVAVKPTKDKVTRFQPLAARYEQGLVKHARTLPVYWEEELLSFPISAHDDCIDAAVYGYQQLTNETQYFTI